MLQGTRELHGMIWSADHSTHEPIYESRKSTLSAISCIAGTTNVRRQSRASGHLDMMCASNGTLVVSFEVDCGEES